MERDDDEGDIIRTPLLQVSIVPLLEPCAKAQKGPICRDTYIHNFSVHSFGKIVSVRRWSGPGWRTPSDVSHTRSVIHHHEWGSLSLIYFAAHIWKVHISWALNMMTEKNWACPWQQRPDLPFSCLPCRTHLHVSRAPTVSLKRILSIPEGQNLIRKTQNWKPLQATSPMMNARQRLRLWFIWGSHVLVATVVASNADSGDGVREFVVICALLSICF